MASNPAPLVICHNSWKKRFSNLIHYYYYYNRQLFPSIQLKNLGIILSFTTVFRNFNLNQNQIITYLEKINENQSIIGGGESIKQP
jgi:hypothetical protein